MTLRQKVVESKLFENNLMTLERFWILEKIWIEKHLTLSTYCFL